MILDKVDGYIYTYYLIFLLVAAGIYFSVKLGFAQIRLIPDGLRSMVEKPQNGENMMKLFSEIGDTIPADDPDEVNAIDNLAEEIGNLKVGLVLPQTTLQKTVGDVFEKVDGLSRDMVLAPTKLLENINYPEEKYDILIVDEAHRLNQRKALISYPAYDKMNKALGLDEEGTALDWVIKCSKRQVLFYDPMQAVHPADINEQYIRDTINSRIFRKCILTSEMRCEGGYDYIEYVKQILSDDPPLEKKSFGDAYDLRFYEDVNQMIADIKERDQEFGLCRNVAGYACDLRAVKIGKSVEASLITADAVIDVVEVTCFDFVDKIRISKLRAAHNYHIDFIFFQYLLGQFGCIDAADTYGDHSGFPTYSGCIFYVESPRKIDRRDFIFIAGRNYIASGDIKNINAGVLRPAAEGDDLFDRQAAFQIVIMR